MKILTSGGSLWPELSVVSKPDSQSRIFLMTVGNSCSKDKLNFFRSLFLCFFRSTGAHKSESGIRFSSHRSIVSLRDIRFIKSLSGLDWLSTSMEINASMNKTTNLTRGWFSTSLDVDGDGKYLVPYFSHCILHQRYLRSPRDPRSLTQPLHHCQSLKS